MLARELPQPRDGGVIDLSSGHDRIVREGENVYNCDIFVLYATSIIVDCGRWRYVARRIILTGSDVLEEERDGRSQG
jgi:hypothetical protein